MLDGHAISEEVRHRLLHQVAKLDTVVIHVNPCDHGGVDPHATRPPPRGAGVTFVGRCGDALRSAVSVVTIGAAISYDD